MSVRWLLLLLILIVPFDIFANPLQLPETGQKSCYDSAGNLIACLGIGQDGEIQSGKAWPLPRFIDNGDQTVTDQLTGLVWSKDANIMAARDPAFDNRDLTQDGAVYWQMALDYIKKLNSENYLGFSDWRLPNARELQSLVDAENFLPALPSDNPFVNIQSVYWTSSTNGSYPANAWTVAVGLDGRLFGFGKYGYEWNVWPVRRTTQALLKTGQVVCADEGGVEIACTGTGQDGDIRAGATALLPRFTDNNDGTITDAATQLIWTKDANLISTRNATFDSDETNGDGLVNWQHALDYVAKLNFEGYLGFRDWRLPNANELASLADLANLNPSLPTGHSFQNVLGTNYRAYWSSTTNSRLQGEAFVASFDSGATRSSVGKSNAYGVWPVRGMSVIEVAPTSLDFGALVPGATRSGVTLTVSDPMTANAVRFYSIEVVGANAGDFAVVPGNTCGSTTVLSPGNSCTVELSFTPSATGPRSATLRFRTDNANSPLQSVSLSGYGAVGHDGIVNPAAGKTAPDIGDAVALLRHVVGLSTLSSVQILHADVAPLGADGRPNPDGKLDISDVIILLRRVAGLAKW